MKKRELAALVGTHCFVELAPGLRVRVRVNDAKISYGRGRLHIEAIDGEGSAWVNRETVQPCYPDTQTNKQGGEHGNA